MTIAILSDIHGNRHALEAVMADVTASGAEEIWCLGDLVGYGAEPDACVEIVMAHADLCLVGNHDLAVRGDLPLTEFSPGAAMAAQWTQEVMTAEPLAFLRTLEPARRLDGVGLFHASPRDPVWEYVLSTLLAELCLDAQEDRVCFIGHSHVALAFWRQEGEPATGTTCDAGTELDLATGEWLINPGSVGQPRDGDPRAAWLLLDPDTWTAAFRRVPYDIAGAAAAIRAARLPESLAERLAYGQ